MGTACGDPALYASLKGRHRFPHDLGNRKIGHLHNRLHTLDILDDQSHPAAHVDQGNDYSLTLFSVKYQTCRILLIHSDTQMMGLDAGLTGSERRADFQHMSAEGIFCSIDKVICVVLHECGSTVFSLAHLLEDSRHGTDFPVAFSAVAVALCHQVL